MSKRKYADIAHMQSNTLAGRAIASNTGMSLDIQKPNAGGMSGNKYGNRKITLDGLKFDSQHEAHRWVELQYMQRAGLISDLRRQVEYVLIPSQTRDGKVIERPVRYVADFVYTQDGEEVVEDAKSPATRTREYIIKRKLMLWEYGIQVREV